jgi:thiosulfate reductase/polysulfide reductase chain A
MYDSKPGWWIARELGLRLGLGEFFPWKNIDEYLAKRLKSAGLEYAELKKTGVVNYPGDGGLIAADHKFDTPSGKIEFWSKTLAEMGVDAVPRHTDKPQPPPGQFRLLFGRAPMHTFGRTTNNRVLGSLMPENEVWINGRAAAEVGVHNGARIRLVNQDGVPSLAVRARVTERIRPDCVYMVHGFGHTASKLRAAYGRGASDSELVTRYEVDPLMGGTGMNVNFVRLERAEKEA